MRREANWVEATWTVPAALPSLFQRALPLVKNSVPATSVSSAAGTALTSCTLPGAPSVFQSPESEAKYSQPPAGVKSRSSLPARAPAGVPSGTVPPLVPSLAHRALPSVKTRRPATTPVPRGEGASAEPKRRRRPVVSGCPLLTHSSTGAS